MNMDIKDFLSLNDKTNVDDSTSHGIHGHVTIYRRNKITGEKTFWYEDDNVISISGMQTILMKILNLHLDSYHSTAKTDNRGRDTNLVIPDLNESMQIGTPVNQYSTMDEDIAVDYFIQGFMVGTGGDGEDSTSVKNTNYSFVNLRRPIPFQQTSTTLDPSISGKYCGKYQPTSSSVKSYYIKKFDALPHIYHSWWVDGQRWDYVDPVVPEDLGPNSANGTGKTDRIETYAECKLSIDESDCKAYFEAQGNAETAKLSELGLVAFDTTVGTRDMLERLYQKVITEMINVIYNDARGSNADTIVKGYAETIVNTMSDAFAETFHVTTQPNLNEFFTVCSNIMSTSGALNYNAYKIALSNPDNIEVTAYYNQDGDYQYESDKFMTYLNDTSDTSIAELTNAEAQRIKLITYYTFNPIPLEENCEILIDYRLYAN